MTHGPTKFPDKGECIYCGAQGIRLTSEHIVPYFIGGQHEIAGASCDDCARITSRFEQRVGQEIWGQARKSFGAPSRHRKRDRWKPKRQLLSGQGAFSQGVLVPDEDVPAPFIYYAMPPAGIFLGLPEEIDLQDQWRLMAIHDDAKHNRFVEKYGFAPKVRFRHQPQEYGQMMLKIGYGQMLTILERSDFDPICVPYILGKKSNVSWLLGNPYQPEEQLLDFGYSLRSFAVGSLRSLLLVSEIKLLAGSSMPWYHAVVGQVEGITAVQNVLNKMAAAGEVLMDAPPPAFSKIMPLYLSTCQPNNLIPSPATPGNPPWLPLRRP